jgi:glutathione S-transferase
VKLHWSPRSPFVRKVMIVLHETGQFDRVDCVRTVVGFSIPPSDEILADNPLGKIPTLVLDDGTSLFDSRVICEYLNDISADRSLLPADGAGRWQQLRWQALGDGLTDILLLLRTEYLRGQPDSAILDAFQRKVVASFAALEAEAAALSSADFGIGHIALVCAIAQLEFRYAGSNWRQAHPALAEWYAGVAARPSVVATHVVDDAAPTGKDTHSLIDFTQSR